MMKRILLIITILIAGEYLTSGQTFITPERPLVCYGSTVTLTLNDCACDNPIVWEYSYDKVSSYQLNSNIKSNTIIINTSVLDRKNTYIRAVVNGNKTGWIDLTYYPDFDFDVVTTNLCEKQIINLKATSSYGLEYEWTLNGVVIAQTAEVNFKVENEMNPEFKVTGNLNGCLKTKSVKYNLESIPDIKMSYDVISCSKGIYILRLTGQTGMIKSSELKIYKGTEADYNNYAIIKKSNTEYEIQWGTTDIPVQLKIKATIITNGNCRHDVIKTILLINEKSPDPGEVFRKSNNNKLLIYRDISNKDSLFYTWGYGSDEIFETPSRPYALFNEIVPSYEYWVKLTFSPNSYCKTRVTYDPSLNSKYQVAVNSYAFFPNPVNNLLNVTSDKETGSLTISFYNLTGILLKKVNLTNPGKLFQVDISDLKPGYVNVRIDEDSCPEYSGIIVITQ